MKSETIYDLNNRTFRWNVTQWFPVLSRLIYQAEVQCENVDGSCWTQTIEFNEGEVMKLSREELLIKMEEKILIGRQRILDRIKEANDKEETKQS